MLSAIVLPPIWAWAKVLLCDSSTLIIADDCDIAIEWLLSFKTSNHIWFSSTRQLFGQVDTLRKQNVAVGGVGVIQHTDKRHVYYLVTKKSSYQKPTYADLSSSLHAMKNHMVLDTAITAMNIENHWFRIVCICRYRTVFRELRCPRLDAALMDWCGTKSRICCMKYSPTRTSRLSSTSTRGRICCADAAAIEDRRVKKYKIFFTTIVNENCAINMFQENVTVKAIAFDI